MSSKKCVNVTYFIHLQVSLTLLEVGMLYICKVPVQKSAAHTTERKENMTIKHRIPLNKAYATKCFP